MTRYVTAFILLITVTGCGAPAWHTAGVAHRTAEAGLDLAQAEVARRGLESQEVHRGFQAADRALDAAGHAIAAWQHGDEGKAWCEVVADAKRSLADAIAVLEGLGVPIPTLIRAGLELCAATISSFCTR